VTYVTGPNSAKTSSTLKPEN